MIKKFRITKKESCPCGSGKTFKECCGDKEPRKFHNNNEALHVIGQLLKKSKRRFCLCDGCASKSKNIIQAHALQENRILCKLAVNNKVIMQDFSKDPVIREITPGKPEPFYFLTDVPISTATTSTCFCKTHDDAIFSKIEKTQYDLQVLDSEQKFLFAYRTFSFELYTEITTHKFYSLMISDVPQTAKNPLVISQYRTQTEKLADLQYYKQYFDNALNNKDFSGLETIVIEMPIEIQFANYMAISPSFDIRGRKIKAIDRQTKRLKFVFFTAFPVENKSYILISVLKEDLKYFDDYFAQIKQAPLPLIQYYLNVLIPLYSQNLILSPNLWSKWDEKTQCGVQFAVADPHSSPLRFYLKTYLRNIAKNNEETSVNPSNIAFNFFEKI